jgi:probable phosphoglycerate mutase
MNAAGLWQGQADPPLTPAGVAQARALAAALAEQQAEAPLAAIFTSDLERARHTAEIVAAALGLRAQPLAALREHDVGAWSGRTRDEIVARWPEEYARLRAGCTTTRFGGGESRSELSARVRAGLAGIAARWAGRRVALVTHLGVLRVLVPGLVLANTEHVWVPAAGAAGGEASA